MARYNSDTWSLELPQGWASEATEECILLFSKKSELGIFQISSFFKEDEEDAVTYTDLLEFAELEESDVEKVETEFLTGIFYQEEADEFTNLFWCFSSGSELIFVAYVVETKDLAKEAEQRDIIINTLRSQY